MSNYKAVIYDLDGTLVDSAPDIAGAVNAALAMRGLTELSVEDVSKMVGSGGRVVCEQALVAAGASHGQEEVEQMFIDFFESYKKSPVVHTKPFPGTIDCLKRLVDAGYKQGVCTNKTGAVTQLVLDGLDIASYFDCVLGGDETEHQKPDPRHLQQVIDELGCAADEVVYVGDTEIDLQTAKSAKVRFFAVSWCRPAAIEDGFTEMLSSLAELPAILEAGKN